MLNLVANTGITPVYIVLVKDTFSNNIFKRVYTSINGTEPPQVGDVFQEEVYGIFYDIEVLSVEML